jgi:uncharacterized protein involved in response to NO
MVALTGGGVALVLWIVMPTWREPLVLVLHVGYAFVALGFLLVGAGTLLPSIIPASAALHAWTAGTMGVMTLAVMTRATLGHTGRALTATGATRAIYVAVVLAALGRIAAPFFGNLSLTVLTVAAGAWTTAFAGFVVAYEPMLLTSRRVAG